MGLKLQDVRFRLGAAFAVLLAVLAVFGWESVSRLHRLNAEIQNGVYVRWTEEEQVREAFQLSNLNNRNVLAIFLLDDPEQIQQLLAERAARSQRLTELIQTIKPTLRTEKEKRLLAAVETARKPYIESYLKALELLLTEHKRDEARRMMIEVTLPHLTTYHDAWLAFVRLQASEIEQAVQRNKASFAEAQQRFLFLTVFAILVTMAVVILVFIQISRGIAALQHERDWLEQRVQARTAELEEASKKAQASEARYRALFEGSSDAIMTLNADCFLDCNEATLKMFGCASKKELIALHPADLSPPHQPSGQDSQAAADQRIAEALVKGTASFEWVHRRCNGEDFTADVLLTALEVELGGQKILQATVRDISERQKAQKALADSESRYRRLFEAAKDGILILDAETGKIKDVNPFLTELLGYTREQFVGKRLWELGSFKDIVANQANFAELQQKKYIRYEDKPLETADGRRIEVEFVSNVYAVDSKKVIQCNIRDVSERKRMEEQNLRLAAIVRSADDAIIGKTLDGIITSWNKGAEQTYGYTENEMVGKSISILVPPGQEDEPAMILEKIRRGEHIDHYETVRRRKDGSSIDVSLSISPMRNVQSKIVGASTVARDITARKRSEVYREIGREILQILNEPGDMQDSIQRVLAALKTRTGLDAVGIRLQNGDDFPYFVQQGFSNDFLQTENTLIERAADGGVCRDKNGNVSLECTCGLVISGKTDPANPLFTPGGSCWTNNSFPLLDIPPGEDPRLHPRNKCIHQGYASVALIPIREKDRIVGLIQLNGRRKGCFTLDTVEILEVIASYIGEALMRKQSDQQLRLQSEAMQAAANGIVITDRDGKIEWANDAFTRLTGYAAAEVIGQNPRFLKSGKQDVAFYKKMWDAILAGQVWHGKLVNKRKDGSLYTEEMTITPVTVDRGQVGHFIGIKQDVTGQLQLEEELRQAQKMETVGRMAGGVAHDFNNILTAIIGYSERTIERLGPKEPMREDVRQIAKAAERATVLTRQLLAFGRRQIFQPTVLDLNVVITGMVQMLQGLISEDIELTTVLAPGLGRTRADCNQVEEVLLNLVMNSRDAIPDKGRLTIETANVELDAEYVSQNPEVKPGSYVMFSVADTGSGMTDAVKQHLFEPFFTTKGVGKGTGMGLASCFGIVKQSGGHITVHSEPGRGTTVRVYLPQVEAPLAAKHEPTAGKLARGTETILLVEDEPVLRELARTILSDLGYAVLEAADGEAALKLIHKKKRSALDLLLSDIMMPRMGGVELAAKVRADYPQIKTLFISGYSAEVITRQGEFEPGTMFLAKPFTPLGLAGKVRETLDS